MNYQYINEFSATSFDDESLIRESDYFLGKAYGYLKERNIRIPEGFVIGSKGFHYFIEETGIKKGINILLSKLDREKYDNLKEIASAIRTLILNARLPELLINEIRDAKSAMIHPLRSALRLTVRTCEDDGHQIEKQAAKAHEFFLNISGEEELFKAVLKSYALLFLDEKLSSRKEFKIDHFEVKICLMVQKMVRSDLACSGIIYGINPEDETDDIIKIAGGWGMMENIIYKKIDPDEIEVSRLKIWENEDPILAKKAGTKEQTLIYFDCPDQTKEPTFVNINTLETKRKKFVLTDSEILQLASWSLIIGAYYNKKMDIVWAKDGLTNELYVVRCLHGK
jgi:pyruvate, water dikinase